MGLSQSAVVSTTKEIKLRPSVRAKLLRELTAYAALRAELKAVEAKMNTHKAVIAALRDDTGEMSLTLEGYTTTLVAPIRRKFNARKFVAEGGDLDLYNQCIDERPTKTYEKITCPGEKTKSNDDDE